MNSWQMSKYRDTSAFAGYFIKYYDVGYTQWSSLKLNALFFTNYVGVAVWENVSLGAETIETWAIRVALLWNR